MHEEGVHRLFPMTDTLPEVRITGEMAPSCTEALVARVSRELGVPDAELRPPLVGAQLMGLVLIRYIIRLEPLASEIPPRLLRDAEILVQDADAALARHGDGGGGLGDRIHRR